MRREAVKDVLTQVLAAGALCVIATAQPLLLACCWLMPDRVPAVQL